MAKWTPYKHSPEEGTAEAADVPWIISVPLGPETEAEVEARLLDEENPPEANTPQASYEAKQ